MEIQPSPTVTRYNFGNLDEVLIEGTSFRPTYANSNGHVFVRTDSTGVAEPFTHDMIAFLVRTGRLKHVKDRFDPLAARKRLENTVAHVSLLPDDVQQRLELRAAIVEGFLELEQEGGVNRTDTSIKSAADAIKTKAEKFLNARRQDRKHGGGLSVTVDPVSPRTMRRWLKAYETFGFAGLADERSKRGNRSSYFTPEERAVLAPEVRKFLSPERPTISTIVESVKTTFGGLNQARAARGLHPLRVPSREAVRSAIRKLDPFQVDVARLGIESARKRHMPVGQGLVLTRPLQRVEMDEWEIDLISVMAEMGLLDLFSDEDKARLGLDKSKARWWITAAECCTTRCIVGLRLSRQPSAASTIETTHMVLRDKGIWADAVNAISPWDMHGMPELLVTDCGSAFRSFEFRSAMQDLGIRTERAIAGIPELRGRIERLFLTISTNLLARLTGRTFSNVLVRGNYDSEARAALTVDELVFALVRWVVDIYHNTPHAGLGGQTPSEAWHELIEKIGVEPPPDLRTRRLVFGTRMKRMVGRKGVEVLGVRYHSDELARWSIHSRDKVVALRWYPEDLGAIEVQIGREWKTVPSVFEMVRGVQAQTWTAAIRQLRASRQAQRNFSEQVVHKAIRDIEAMNTAASRRIGLLVDDWSEKRLQDEEDRLLIGFDVAPTLPANADKLDEWGIVIPTASASLNASRADEHVEDAQISAPPQRWSNEAPVSDPVVTMPRQEPEAGGWNFSE